MQSSNVLCVLWWVPLGIPVSSHSIKTCCEMIYVAFLNSQPSVGQAVQKMDKWALYCIKPEFYCIRCELKCIHIFLVKLYRFCIIMYMHQDM